MPAKLLPLESSSPKTAPPSDVVLPALPRRPDDCAQKTFDEIECRATTITLVLSGILKEQRVPHGGICE